MRWAISFLCSRLHSAGTLPSYHKPYCLKLLRRWIESMRKLAQACIASTDDGLRPVGDLKFAEDTGDVIADGLGADNQPFCNLGITYPMGNQVQDFPLTGR